MKKTPIDWKRLVFVGLSVWVAFVFIWLLMGMYLPHYHRIGAYSGPSILIVGVIIFIAICLRMGMNFVKALRWLISSVLVVSSLFIVGLELTGEALGHSVNPPFTLIAILVLIIFGISFILRLWRRE